MTATIREAASAAAAVDFTLDGRPVSGRSDESLLHIARRHGIQGFKAEVLAHNGAMLAVFRRSGLPLRQRQAGEVVHVSLSLQPAPG